ncbi:BPL-N domain-containing protein [Desulfosoma sp.]
MASHTHADHSAVPPGSRTIPCVALLWDQSLVWGLLVLDALEALGFPYRPLRAADIREGALAGYGVLIVPGGWAAHKARALGSEGLEKIRQFVVHGGAYVGFCGGAGLALDGSGSLNLVPIGRKALSRRLPNASGEVWIDGDLEHPFWKDLPARIPVSVWWPSQFASDDGAGVECVARYVGPGEDFWVADLCAADVAASGGSWKDWERAYGINLDPALLRGQPAILSCRVGDGCAVLSYPHLETPDGWGRRLLSNILRVLQRERPGARPHDPVPESPSLTAYHAMEAAFEEVRSLVAFGERHLLWRWRRPWVLQWQRGVRGLEYGTLCVCLRFVLSQCRGEKLSSHASPSWEEPAEALLGSVRLFCRRARRLLLEEKAASHNGPVGKLQPVNPTVDALRQALFGRGMSHAGLSQELFDSLDTLLYLAVERRRHQGQSARPFWTAEPGV